MSEIQHTGDRSPFDAIKRVTPEGREYWSARELQPLLGYDQWRRFGDAIARARISGCNAGHDMARHIAGAGKMVQIGSGAEREVENFHLSRLACYLIAMNGDPRKPEVAAYVQPSGIDFIRKRLGLPTIDPLPIGGMV